MSVNYKKVILSTILFTLCALFVASAIICMLMFFVFTKDLANFFYSMGSENIAANLYHRVYEKTGDIFYCYKSLNIEIKLEDNNNIIKYYQEFKNDDEYEKFMSDLKKNNERIFVGVLEKSTLLNEIDYLENKYISALKNTNAYDQAFALAVEYFSNYELFDFENQGVYALHQFVSNSADLDLFQEQYDKYNTTLIQSLQDYFNDAVLLFESKTPSTDLEKSYLIALGNRIITVGQNINTIYNADNSNTDLVSNNIENMTNINNVIKGLV